MQGKILIVDTIATNRIVLKVKLSSAFYQVLQADSVAKAVELAKAEPPDLVLTAARLPDGDAADLARAMTAAPMLRHIPILALQCTPCQADRIALLEAGIHDIMTRPLEDTLLLGRVRSLIRASNAAKEWRMRDDTSRALGVAEPPAEFAAPGRVLLIADEPGKGHKWVALLRQKLQSSLSFAAFEDVLATLTTHGAPDALVLCLPPEPLRARELMGLISALRANSETRYAGLLVLQSTADADMGAHALDLGADDLMTDGFDAVELSLRIKALIRRKLLGDQLRASVRTGLQAALYDALTGLHNRRYALPHLTRIAEHAAATNRPFAVMVADMDHFKSINDVYGHASGDAVLVETAKRLRRDLRAVDLVARLGGEEFLIVMPGVSLAQAEATARRLCETIAHHPFDIPGAVAPVTVTTSIGLAMGPLQPDGTPQSSDALIDMADKALYAAKMKGRNRVTLSRPAA